MGDFGPVSIDRDDADREDLDILLRFGRMPFALHDLEEARIRGEGNSRQAIERASDLVMQRCLLLWDVDRTITRPPPEVNLHQSEIALENVNGFTCYPGSPSAGDAADAIYLTHEWFEAAYFDITTPAPEVGTPWGGAAPEFLPIGPLCWHTTFLAITEDFRTYLRHGFRDGAGWDCRSPLTMGQIYQALPTLRRAREQFVSETAFPREWRFAPEMMAREKSKALQHFDRSPAANDEPGGVVTYRSERFRAHVRSDGALMFDIGDSDRPGEPKRRWYGNHDRDVWMYGQRKEGKKPATINAALQKHHPEWPSFDSDPGLLAAIRRLSEREPDKYPPLQKFPAGRPPKSKRGRRGASRKANSK